MRFLRRYKSWAWIVCLVIACACFGIGAFRGEFHTIWQKASVICLECIGIG